MATKKKEGEEEFSVSYIVYASTSVTFFAPSNSTYEELVALAEKRVECPSVCHQCSNHIDICDLGDLNEIFNITKNCFIENPEK